MSWFKKLFTIGVNTVNEKGEQAVVNFVDISREGKAIVAKRKKDIENSQKSILESNTTVKKHENRIKRNEESLRDWNLIAEQAVKAGNDGDALKAVTQIEIIESENETLKSVVEDLKPLIAKRKAQLDQMEIDVFKIEHEIERLSILHESLKDREKATGKAEGSLTNAFNVEDLRNIVDNAKARVEAKEELGSNDLQDLTKKYSSTQISAEDRLAKLKEKINGPQEGEKKRSK